MLELFDEISGEEPTVPSRLSARFMRVAVKSAPRDLLQGVCADRIGGRVDD